MLVAPGVPRGTPATMMMRCPALAKLSLKARRQARAVRVPTPRAVAVDRVADGRPYILVEHVAGVPGTHAADRNALLQALGRVAARLHGVRTHGIGHVFDWAPAERTRATSMAEWIDGHYRATDRIALLRRHGVIDAAQARALAATAATLRRWRRPPVLQHGDLRLKNVMVDATTGRLAALLDWDDARSMPGPHWDLSIALHDLGIDGKEAFLHGYGLTPRAYAALLPGIRLFNVLNYAHALRSAMRHRDARRLAWLRVRCSGALDLYRP